MSGGGASDAHIDGILFLFIAILCGGVTNFLLSRTSSRIPYTVVMCIEGVIFGVILEWCDIEPLTESMELWSQIDSKMLLFLFLPVLTFSDAMHLSWYKVKDFFLQAFMLAGPGVILTTIIIGAVVKALPLSWSWTLATLFGTVVSATDPVASVAILKHAGASPSLIILILGESLMSEAGAAVLYHLFSSRLEGHYHAEDIGIFLVRDFLLSPVVGIVFGLAAVRVMKFANQTLRATDSIYQIAITLCCAYLCFYVSQHIFYLSGVLACCGAGVVVGTLAPSLILKHEAMHAIWELLDWLASSLLFLLAGLIVSHKAIEHANISDLYYVFLLYLILVVTRFFVVAAVTPLVRRTGPEFTTKEASFMGLTGLRGAMGILLTLSVLSIEDIHTPDANHFVIIASGVIGLTLLINGSMSQLLLEWCGLDDTTPEKLFIYRNLRILMRGHMVEYMNDLKLRFETVDIATAARYSTLMAESERQSDLNEKDVVLAKNGFNDELMKQLRSIFLSTVRSCYFHHIEMGKLPRHSYSSQILLRSIDHALSLQSVELMDWRYIHRHLYARPLEMMCYRLLDKLLHMFRIPSEFVADIESKYEKRSVYILNSFIKAHEESQHKMRNFIRQNRSDEGIKVGTAEIAQLIRLSEKSVEAARALYGTLPNQDRQEILLQQVAKIILHEEVTYLEHVIEQGLLTPRDAEQSMRQIIADADAIEKDRKRITVEVMERAKIRRRESTVNTLHASPILNRPAVIRDDMYSIDND